MSFFAFATISNQQICQAKVKLVLCSPPGMLKREKSCQTPGRREEKRIGVEVEFDFHVYVHLAAQFK